MERGLLFLSLLLAWCCCVSALQKSDYDFHKVLDSEGQYELYWSYDLQQSNIAFVVRVGTTGWIGFGLSPNGQMPQSDVVIGWVDDDGNGYLQDRFAEDRTTPPLDQQQDWYLTGAKEENGSTTLEFTRKLLTCDERDLEIMADTSRVIWSYSLTDPDDITGPTSVHFKQGVRSINLLSGIAQDSVPTPNHAQSFTIQVENLLVPNDMDTTYWCITTSFSTGTNERIYIYKFGPVIHKHAAAYVHHMVAYLCPITHSLPHNFSDNCYNSGVHNILNPCRFNEVIGAWAVGGEDFAFPEGVAFAVEGDDTNRFVMLEMHYDNPDLVGGVYDSSGLEFFYSTTPPEKEAGTLSLGRVVSPTMFIPPNTDSFAIGSICSAECLGWYLPEDGINIFANLLHTHLLGYALTVHHFTSNEQCGVTEELKPVDQNPKYDFDYQQITHLPREVTVKPGDSLGLTCYYRSAGSGRSGVTLGGLGTRDEMCATFLYYYPRTNLSGCVTVPDIDSGYQEFVNSNVHNTTEAQLLMKAFHANDGNNVNKILNTVEWDDRTVQELQEAVLNAPQSHTCFPNTLEELVKTIDGLFPHTQPVNLTKPDCSYEAPDRCTGRQPMPCCERLRQEEPPSPSPTQSSPSLDGAGILAVSITTLLIFLVASITSIV